MLSLSSTAEAAAALRGARTAFLTAYALRHGEVFDALEAAARTGAHVSVRLAGAPYDDAGGSFARANAAIVSELRGAGVDAGLTAREDAPVHAKVLEVDGALYLDDRNWGAGDLVLRDDDPGDPGLASHKREALAGEAALLRTARPGDDAIVESESFGCCNAVYSAVNRLANAGVALRVLVCARELSGNEREREILTRLARDGARIRVTCESDKLAITGQRAWIGSANATAAIALPDTVDWGCCSDDATVVAAVRARVASTWERARPFIPGPHLFRRS